PLDRQQAIVERLLEEEDPDRLIAWLQEDCGLDEAAARAVADAPLPQGHGRLGRTALTRLVQAMREGSVEETDPETGEIYARPLRYDEAVEKLGEGKHHSALGPGKEDARLSCLP